MTAKEKTIIAPISLVLKKGDEPTAAGTPITLPADEADDLITRFGAVEHEVEPEPEPEPEPKPRGRGKSGD